MAVYYYTSNTSNGQGISAKNILNKVMGVAGTWLCPLSPRRS